MPYFDTSAVVPYFCPEKTSPIVERLLQESPERQICPLTEVEFASALAQKTRAAELRLADARKIWHKFQQALRSGAFTVVSLEISHFQQAAEWLSQFNTTLRTLDALHLAVAAGNDSVLVTGDAGLARAAGRLGIKAKLIIRK